MKKEEKNSRKIDAGKLVVGDDGVHFMLGKNRIVVTEHFSANPKTIEDRIEELIIYASNSVTADN